MKNLVRILLFVGICAVAALLIFSRPALPQDQSYHRFADQRTFFAVPYFANVVSNAPFLAIGVAGLWVLRRAVFLDPRERWPYFVLFVGIGLTAFGSTWYHLAPTNASLVWDRLPMTVAFMGLFSAMLSDRLGPSVGAALLLPLVVAGIGSVVWWDWTDDLRPYWLVQLAPLTMTPFLMLLFPPRYTRSWLIWLALACYVAAKGVESHDAMLYEMTGVSGHTIKHLLAAVGAYWLLHMVLTRRVLKAPLAA